MPLYMPADTYSAFQGQTAVAQAEGDYHDQLDALHAIAQAHRDFYDGATAVLTPTNAPPAQDTSAAPAADSQPPPPAADNASAPPSVAPDAPVTAPLHVPQPAPDAPVTAPLVAPSNGQRFSPFDDVFARHAGALANNPEFMSIVAAGTLAESGWNPGNTTGDGGHSWGLFQMHDGGAGAGMGNARLDPDAASAVMVPKYAQAYLQAKAANPNLSGPGLAAVVAQAAERSADSSGSAYASAYRRLMGGQAEPAPSQAESQPQSQASAPQGNTAQSVIQNANDLWNQGREAATGAIGTGAAKATETADSLIQQAHDAWNKGVDSILTPDPQAAALVPKVVSPDEQLSAVGDYIRNGLANDPIAQAYGSDVRKEAFPNITEPNHPLNVIADPNATIEQKSDAVLAFAGSGDVKAISDLAQALSKAPPAVVQDLVKTAEQAVSDLRTRFPQMSEGSLAASGPGKQLAALQQAVKEAAIPEPAAAPAAAPAPPAAPATDLMSAPPPRESLTAGAPEPSVPQREFRDAVNDMPAGAPEPTGPQPGQLDLGLNGGKPGENLIQSRMQPPLEGGFDAESLQPMTKMTDQDWQDVANLARNAPPAPSGDVTVEANPAWAAHAEGKQTIFSLSLFHNITVGWGTLFGPAGADGFAKYVAAQVNPKYFDNLKYSSDLYRWFVAADKAGIPGVLQGVNPETGVAKLSPVAQFAVRSGIGGAAGFGSGYESAKLQGQSDSDAITRGLIAGGIGAALGPTLSQGLHQALWERGVPLSRVLTFKTLVESGAPQAEAARFVRDLEGGGQLEELVSSPSMQRAVRLVAMAPDWLISQFRLGGAAATGAAKTIPGAQKVLGPMAANEQAARDFWVKSVGVGMLATEVLQQMLTGHTTLQNQPGNQFMVEVPNGQADKRGMPNYTTWSMLPGNVAPILDLAAGTTAGASQGDPTRALGSFVHNRLSPVVEIGSDLYKNTDFRGQPLVAPGTPPQNAVPQIAASVASRFSPIGISTPQQELQQGAPLPAVIAGTLGVKVGHTDPATALMRQRDQLVATRWPALEQRIRQTSDFQTADQARQQQILTSQQNRLQSDAAYEVGLPPVATGLPPKYQGVSDPMRQEEIDRAIARVDAFNRDYRSGRPTSQDFQLAARYSGNLNPAYVRANGQRMQQNRSLDQLRTAPVPVGR